MEYITVLQMFVISILFDKSDYNPNHKNFKPLKVLVIFALLGNLWFTAYLIQTIHRIHTVVEKECPSLLLEKKAKEDTSVEKKKD